MAIMQLSLKLKGLTPGAICSKEKNILAEYPMNPYKAGVVRPLIWRYGQENTNLSVEQMNSLHVTNRDRLDSLDKKYYNYVLGC